VTADPTRRRVPAWLSFGVLVASLGILGWFVGRDLDALDALGTVAPADVILILLLQGLYLIPESYRQQVVIESAGRKRLPVVGWFRVFVVGRFLNSIIPQSGNVYRALRLKTDYQIEYVDFIGSMVLFLVMSVSFNLGLAAVLIAVDPPESSVTAFSTPWVLLAAALVVVGVPVLLRLALGRIAVSDSPWFAPLRALRDLLNSAAAAVHQQGLLIRFVGAWLVTLGVVVALYAAIFSVVGASIGIGEIIALYALVQATSFVVITPGNLGIQELGFTALAALFGIPVAQGAATAAIIRASGWIALAIPAFILGGQDVVSYLRTPPE